MQPVVEKRERDESVYYTIRWSRLTKVDKYTIASAVPAVGGIFELYYEDVKKKLNLFFVSKAWFGGLRNQIRKQTDPELEDDPYRKNILNTYPCYYRYTMLESSSDMADILFFFAQTYFPHKMKAEDSGRYEQIFIKELSDDKIVTI
ncbi:MAG: hypothetical protein JW881_13275 [Spirochaetales bacterium]|nr:hypothetical protein [Spirochaetales bacterium]